MLDEVQPHVDDGTIPAHYAEKYRISRLQDFVVEIIKQGSVPRHVGFIMDGNRRYARSKGIPIMRGHEEGGEKMINVLGWCGLVGVYAVTTFAFSLDNFGRPQEEIDGLLQVFEDAMTRYLDEVDLMIKGGIQFRVIGRMELFPERLRVLAGELMERTRHCKDRVYSVAMPYAGRDDMTCAINQLKEGVRNGLIQPDDVSEALLEQCLQTGDLPPLDMIVRTSGEMRFSSFMMWQSAYSFIAFDKVLWPNYGFWNVMGAMLKYQLHADYLKPYRRKSERKSVLEIFDSDKRTRIANFLKYLDHKHTEHISSLQQQRECCVLPLC